MQARIRTGAPPSAYGDGQAFQRLAVVKVATQQRFVQHGNTVASRWRSYAVRRRARWNRQARCWEEAGA